MKRKYWQPFVSCIVKHENKILALKRISDGYFGDYYDFPGGKIEYGETIIEALKREVYEESGIKIDENNLKLKASIDWIDDFKDEQRYAVCFCFVYEISKKPIVKIKSDEHTEFEWMEKEDSRMDEFLKTIIARCKI